MGTQLSLVEKITTPTPLVIGLAKDEAGLLVLVTSLKGLDTQNLLQTLNSFKATGKADEVTFVPDATHGILIFTGLGTFEKRFSAKLYVEPQVVPLDLYMRTLAPLLHFRQVMPMIYKLLPKAHF